MLWEVLGSTLLGLAASLAAVHWLVRWFPNRVLVLATGPGAGLLGGLVARVVLGPGQLPVILLVALVVTAALLSLLIRPPGGTGPRDRVPGSTPRVGPA